MNVGFVSTWLERGASYVTKAYIEALKKGNRIYVYARGGEKYERNNPNWDKPYVTWGLKLYRTKINKKNFKKWVEKNKIDIIFFNEQRDIEILIFIKTHFPNIKLGAYIDYYKEDSVDDFKLYDFLICNTKRHYSVFKDHPQCYFVPWGTDIDLFKPKYINNSIITFFHSAGMSKRKGTKLLIDAFIEGKLYKVSKLIIHTQINSVKLFGYDADHLREYNIEVIEKTVSSPGLYHLGDVYVYPTTLDGLGLTIYEALSCGLPVITTDNAPMNEVINLEIGRLVEVEKLYCRNDGYYWPLALCEKESLIEQMNYYIENKSKIKQFKKDSRLYAVNYLNWRSRFSLINDIFFKTEIINNKVDYKKAIEKEKRINRTLLYEGILSNLPDYLVNIANKLR